MSKRTPEICPYCGHVILDDDQEYCDSCGMKVIEKEDPDNKMSSGSCLGTIATVILFIFLVVFLFSRK